MDLASLVSVPVLTVVAGALPRRVGKRCSAHQLYTLNPVTAMGPLTSRCLRPVVNFLLNSFLIGSGEVHVWLKPYMVYLFSTMSPLPFKDCSYGQQLWQISRGNPSSCATQLLISHLTPRWLTPCGGLTKTDPHRLLYLNA